MSKYVRCIKAEPWDSRRILQRGAIYKVVERDANGVMIRLEGGDLSWFTIDRFEDVNDTIVSLAEKRADDVLEDAMKGVKHDQGKAPISLIPVEAIIEEAEVFAFGAKKYGKHNFRQGMDHTRIIDALLRHALAIANGEDIDPESGLPHRAHARCCLSMLTYYQRNNVGRDDRFKKETVNE